MEAVKNPIVRVNLGSMDRVKAFVETLSNFDGHFDLISGHYMVDAKSILGVFSMNYKDTIDLRIIESSEEMPKIMEALEPYLA